MPTANDPEPPAEDDGKLKCTSEAVMPASPAVPDETSIATMLFCSSYGACESDKKVARSPLMVTPMSTTPVVTEGVDVEVTVMPSALVSVAVELLLNTVDAAVRADELVVPTCTVTAKLVDPSSELGKLRYTSAAVMPASSAVPGEASIVAILARKSACASASAMKEL